MIRRPLLWAALLGAALLGLAIADRALPPSLARAGRLGTAVTDDRGQLMDAAPASDGAFRLATAPGDVDPAYLRLLLATEDRRFWHHPGVDPFALGRAAWQLAWRGHIVSGGSTLAMQVARLLHPHRHTLAGKVLDITRALQLTARLPRVRILALYLTLAPEGGGIEGVRAASLAWFGHGPERLDPAEAAMLVAVPRSPVRLRPDRHPAALLAAMNRLLVRAGEPPVGGLPVLRVVGHDAPHLRDRFHGQDVATTLDGALQRAALQLAAAEAARLGADVALMVVRLRDRAVRAYVGGTAYFGPGGMNDMLRATRSPGSALKPFLYGLAFDDGLAGPATLLADARLRVGGYAPQDFDRTTHGMLTAAEALQRSANLPAVALLARVGPGRFVAALRDAGARLVLPRGAGPSLPVAIGGVGITPFDLAMLYTAVANRGEAAPLRLRQADTAGGVRPLLTAASAAAITAILRGTPAPVGTTRTGALAYKTGTSYGFRDAWAAGYTPDYAAVVWTGRPDGTPRPGATGITAAAPILFHLLDLVPGNAPEVPVARRASFGPGVLAAREGPRILYPPPNAVLDAVAAPPIALEAAGGVPPYRWLADNVPVPPSAFSPAMTWHPPAAGFAHLAVIDAANHVAAEEVRVR